MFSRRTKSFVKFIKLLSVLETVCVQCLITHAQYLRATPFSGRFRTIRTHTFMDEKIHKNNNIK